MAAQLYKKEDQKTWDREGLGGGKGVIGGKFAFTRTDAPADWIIKEIGWMTVQPGDSLGMHGHETNEDAYIIVSGEGAFTDKSGVETPVRPGDVTIARRGESHALKNTGDEPLVFLGIIAQS